MLGRMNGQPPSRDLSAMRQSYEFGGLSTADLAADWLTQLQAWLSDAAGAGLREPNAMVLATASPDGVPSARTVLLKALDARGLVLFTNRRSRKGRETHVNPVASLVFPWHELQRQVVVCGGVAPVDDSESDTYFATRGRGAQIGALASAQSQVISGRAVLDDARSALQAHHQPGTAIARPAHWGGLRVVPDSVEFWQGRPDRLHDRLRYRRAAEGWIVERLAP